MLDKFVKNVIGITGQGLSNRYLNMDGTPYGARGLARHLISPGLPESNAIACLMDLGFCRSFNLPDGFLASLIAGHFLINSSLIGLRRLGGMYHINMWGGAIDTWGKQGDVIKSYHMGKLYQDLSVVSFVGAAIMGRAGIITGIPAFSNRIFGALSDARASRKLLKGEWRMVESPPPLKNKKKAPKPKRAAKRQAALG